MDKSISVFNRTYLPNGQQVEREILKKNNMKQFHFDDWHRKDFGYQTFFIGEKYHLTKDRD